MVRVEEDAWFEYALAFTGIENLTAKAIWSDLQHQDDYEIMTYWASYQLDKLLRVAAEVAAEGQSVADDDIDAFLIMGNYAITDAVAINT